MSNDLSAPAALVAERLGLHFQEDRWPELARGLEKAGASLGFNNLHAFITHLLARPLGQRELQALAASLTVGETHFFRSTETFNMLQTSLLPGLIMARRSTGRNLRIWSAGCAGGQEPFSLAILLSRLLDKSDGWDVTILATDINPDAFATADNAVYTQWSFRGTPSWVVNGYFSKTSDGRYRLSPAIKDMVTFRYLNLAEDAYPSASIGICDFDLILCRNVIMYFSRDTAVKVAGRLQNCLREGGYLLLTPSESSRDIQQQLTSVLSGGEIVYRRITQAEAAGASVGKTPAPSGGATGAGASESPKSNANHLPHRARTSPRKSERSQHAPVQESSTPAAAHLRVERRATGRAERPGKEQDAPKAAREARELADKGELVPALDRCEAALTTDKLNPSLYYLKASILQELGRSDEAERALQSTLFLDGNFAPARVMLGAIARGQSRPEEAVKHFRAALSLLAQMPSDLVLPETDGLTAGEMADTVASLMGSECAS